MSDNNSRQLEPSANHGGEGGKHHPTPPTPPTPATPHPASDHASPVSGSEDVMDVLAAVEQQLNRLRMAHKGQDDAFSTMSARSQSLRDAEQGIEQTRKEFNERSAQMEQQRRELQDRLEQAEKNVGDLMKQMESTGEELSAKSKDLKKAGTEANKLHKQIEQFEETASVSQKRIAELEQVLSQIGSRSTDAAAQLKSEQKRVGDLEKELADRNKQFSVNQGKLDQTGKKLTEFAKILSEQTPQLERGAAAVAMVQQQQDQIDRLTKQIAEQKLKVDPEEMERKDERIEQLTQALRESRAQTGGNEQIATMEGHNAKLSGEVDRLKLELQNAQVAVDQARQQIKEHAESKSGGILQDAAHEANVSKISQLSAENEKLRGKLHELQQSQQPAKKGAVVSSSADKAEISRLRDRVVSLETELAEANHTKSQIAHEEESGGTDSLREKAEQIGAFAEHLRRRGARLARVRELLKQKLVSGDNTSLSERMQTDELIKIERERLQLADVRRMLEKSERKMMKKWAGSRAVALVGWMVILVATCGAGAWFGADHFFPAKISSSVVLEAKGRSPGEVKAEPAAAWRDWHVGLLNDPEFQRTLSKRMAERQLQEWSDVRRLALRLKDDLTIDSERKGMLVFTLAGIDEDDLTSFLDILTSTMMGESNRQMTTRPDNLNTVATGERKEGGRVRFASMNSTPISDERLRYALPIFGGLFLVSLIAIVFSFKRLMRAKRVFDEENEQLFTDAKINAGP